MFYQLFKQEVDTQIAKRWQALWVLRRGERWKWGKEVGGQPQADLAGVQGLVGDHAAFPKGKAAGEGVPYAPESCGAGICRGSAVVRRATV